MRERSAAANMAVLRAGKVGHGRGRASKGRGGGRAKRQAGTLWRARGRSKGGQISAGGRARAQLPEGKARAGARWPAARTRHLLNSCARLTHRKSPHGRLHATDREARGCRATTSVYRMMCNPVHILPSPIDIIMDEGIVGRLHSPCCPRSSSLLLYQYSQYYCFTSLPGRHIARAPSHLHNAVTSPQYIHMIRDVVQTGAAARHFTPPHHHSQMDVAQHVVSPSHPSQTPPRTITAS